MLNNHPIIGICCHHRLHPLKTGQRFIILLGSFAFGVAITNVCYLWFISTGRDAKQEIFSIDLNTQESAHYSVTAGLVMLVTVGSGLHTIFDRFVWSLSACRCCRAGGTFETSVKDFELEDFSFLKAYCIEFAVSLFLYYPLLDTVLFSGILGCYRLPILGGRPYEVRKEEKKRITKSGARRVSALEMA